MARLPRFFVRGYPLHVIQRGNNREDVFSEDADYHIYLEWLTEAANRHGCAIHAYVLMTNHVHLLLTPAHASSLPKTLQSLGRRYVQYVNRTYQRTGTLWEGRYRATLIDSDSYLLTCCRYIELNPVRAEMGFENARVFYSGILLSKVQGHLKMVGGFSVISQLI